jgi:beta-lactamase superfamily II metal-dependent hydrolase
MRTLPNCNVLERLLKASLFILITDRSKQVKARVSVFLIEQRLECTGGMTWTR